MAAMEAMQGYIDITPSDFMEVYRVAYALAHERMMNALKAADIMTTPVHAVDADADLVAAATLLAEKGVSGAPVIARWPRPRNLIGGHVLSAILGVAAFQFLGQMPWLAAATAVSTAIALMHLTKTLHPPGGATALIAVIGGDAVHQLGYLYALIPAGSGALIMLIVGLLINNLAPNRRYPEFWL